MLHDSSLPFYISPDCSGFFFDLQIICALLMASSLLRYRSLQKIRSLCTSTACGATFSTSCQQPRAWLFSNLLMQGPYHSQPCQSSFPHHQINQEPAMSVHHHQDSHLHLQPHHQLCHLTSCRLSLSTCTSTQGDKSP